MKTITCLISFCLSVLAMHAQQSFNISFVHDGKTVHGTFKVPAGNKRFKTLILAPGSGPNDRYGTLPMVGANTACLYPGLLNDTIRAYDELSDALQDAGYAVLIYDKLEYTYPGSMGTITFHKLWLPVESAIDYVKTRSDVDTGNIILLGHSEGSSLIPYIAKGRKDIRALISIAGSRTPFDSTLARQLVYIAQTCGGDVQTAQYQADQILAYFNLIRTNTWNSSTPPLFGVPASAWREYVLATDPVADHYDVCGLPALFLGLEKDINVPPSELDRFKAEVSVTDDFWKLPSLIHYMTTADDPHISKTVPDTIIHWLRSNGFHASMKDVKAIERSVSVKPNPFGSSLTVSVGEPYNRNCSMRLLDMTGRVIPGITGIKSPQSFDTGFLDRGVYILQIQTEGYTICKKLVKH